MPVTCSTKCLFRLTVFLSSLKSGGLAEEVDEKILHAAFVPFGDIKDVKTPLDQATQKHRYEFQFFIPEINAKLSLEFYMAVCAFATWRPI